MSGLGDKEGGNGEKEKEPFSQYQLDLYAFAIMGGKKPITTTDPNKLEQKARKAMSPEGFNYVFGGAGEQATMQASRLAFRQWKLIPRLLRPTLPRDLRVKLFGRTYAYHADAETGVASACASLSVPFVYSTASSTGLEAVAAAAAADAAAPATAKAPRWFQLYWPLDDDITASLLGRARATGCEALVVTLDTFTMAWRPLDLDAGFLPFAVGEGNALGFGDAVEDNVMVASRFWTGEVFSGHAHCWEDLATLRRLWGDGPIILKGVLSIDDALAVRSGVDGIIMSNHGGRQLDGAVPSLEMLPEIVEAVGDKLTVLFDSGIRTGADVLKALALGAKAVFVGRPVIYGLGIAGREGARHVLTGLLADVDQSMGLAGVQTVGELNRSMLRRINYGGDIKSSL
ncbi:FMN-dependent dehydrogenase [Lasiosphaeria miniovina]|uniref:FMN-dependent dehydrogenase n=1 Tax=Lasiosphaeria miniovina TaxID=1954250 RepID=A0AA39ZUI2_9PEZI|nr:FMN-dependent dehydrogenase [Lasiosphaeria miniovina]KAK0703823.1 FMN-dependent dehydrogenase [Lasiosphaeria miniovina]